MLYLKEGLQPGIIVRRKARTGIRHWLLLESPFCGSMEMHFSDHWGNTNVLVIRKYPRSELFFECHPRSWISWSFPIEPGSGRHAMPITCTPLAVRKSRTFAFVNPPFRIFSWRYGRRLTTARRHKEISLMVLQDFTLRVESNFLVIFGALCTSWVLVIAEFCSPWTKDLALHGPVNTQRLFSDLIVEVRIRKYPYSRVLERFGSF